MVLQSLPAPFIRASEDVPTLGWGILGPGGIARSFARALRTQTDQDLVAVGGRSAERSRGFADEFEIPKAYGSASELVADEAVDAVYIATPHPFHRDLALTAIAAGTHVLIEKPIAMSAHEAREIASAAEAAGVLVMEAMWTRFLPQTEMLHRLVHDGELGEIRQVNADFGFAAPYDQTSRLWAPELGGGALLDAGVYPISFSVSLMGAPSRFEVSGRTGPGGVDAAATVLADWDGAQGSLSTAIDAPLPTRALVVGERGRIDIDSMFIGPSTLHYTPAGTLTPTLSWRDARFSSLHDGMREEILAFAHHVGERLLDSPVHSLRTAISVMEIIDESRARLAG